MVKNRVGQQLKDALLGTKSHSKKSAELDYLAGQFKQLKLKIRALVEGLKMQHISLLRMNESRLIVAKCVADLAIDCPISDEAGTAPSNECEIVAKDLNSYMSVHHHLHNRQKLYCNRFSEHVLDYAIEWERIIVARVSSSLSRAERLRRDLDHYKQKVDRMKMEKSKVISQGKSIDPKFTERLARNESKLSISREEYDIYAGDLCTLIQEVTIRSWKDLHPILLKMAQFDATLASDEHKLLENLNVVSSNLKKVAHRYGLKAETRLRDLETLSGKLIVNGDGDKIMIEGQNNRNYSRSTDRSCSEDGPGRISSKENDDAVVRDVVNLLSKKTTNSEVSTEITTNMPKSPLHSTRSNKYGSNYSETDKALDNLMQSSRSGSRGGNGAGSRSGSRNGSRHKTREFSGQPKQMNKQGFNSRSGSGDRPPSRSSNRPSSRSRRKTPMDDDTAFDNLDARVSTPRRQYSGSQRTPTKLSSSPKDYGQQENSPSSNARAYPQNGNNEYRKKWSNELVSSVEPESNKPSSWYNSFF